MGFQLHPDLQRDGIAIGRFPLCRVSLINESAYPWFVLIPEREGIRKTVDLTFEDHELLWRESRVFGSAIMELFQGDQLNVAALGNMTPQLHVHHIVRFDSDAAWPGPIWGKQPLAAYADDAIEELVGKLAAARIDGFQVSR